MTIKSDLNSKATDANSARMAGVVSFSGWHGVAYAAKASKVQWATAHRRRAIKTAPTASCSSPERCKSVW